MDAFVSVLLVAVTVAYLAVLPLRLLSPDEAKGLNEARRILGAMRGRTVSVFAAGALVGAIVMVHQHRGISLGLGVGLIVVADNWLNRPAKAAARSLMMRNLAAWAGGVLVVVVPFGIALLARAGVDPVWRSLVVFPLTQYRAVNYMTWGGWLFKSRRRSSHDC